MKKCRDVCCNPCGWEASLDGKSGAHPVDVTQVRALLGVDAQALECELDAWNDALAGQSVSVDAKCVAR
jgi:hypothetical protein